MEKGFKRFIDGLKRAEDYKGQIAWAQNIPARRAVYADVDPPFPKLLAGRLKTLGLQRLFTHQARAIDLVRDGRDVVVATETASGKSLCYHLPVLETLLEEPDARALYLFPTKALAQDQARSLLKIIAPKAPYDETKTYHSRRFGKKNVAVGTYDGDTPRTERAQIRRRANVILTNPDMLSLGIMPNHANYWTPFFSKLRYIVVDELHVYRGVFGSHVANVMRRLERVCAQYGARPQFICCSATTANPKEHAAALLHRDPEIIDTSGAPAPKKTFLFWNPPLHDQDMGLRSSALNETVKLFSGLVGTGARTIVFARAKPTVEVILKFTRDRMDKTAGMHSLIASYRGGYLPSDRREIEKQLSQGALIGVTCTNALELGVDIGSLDAAVINGYPGAIASTWQQAGRAGRRGRESLAVLVAYDEPLDQYFMRHPEYFFEQKVEHAIINPDNPYIQALHLKAASYEAPLRRSEEELFGGGFVEQVRDMVRKGDMKQVQGRAVWAGADFPAQEINLRTATAQRFAICLPDGTQIGMMDADTVFHYLHQGAVYLHQGEAYYVEELDVEARVARVVRRTMPYYTRALSRSDVSVDREISAMKFRGTPVFRGFVNVTSRVHSYKKISHKKNQVIARVPLEYPSEVLWTHALWFLVGQDIVRRVKNRRLDLLGGLHAVEHATIAMLPFLAMCDRDDIGGLSTNYHQDTGAPTVFIHDAFPGGMGLSELGYENFRALLERARDLIKGCPCKHGCPSCIHSPKCGNMNDPLDKQAALLILKSILGK